MNKAISKRFGRLASNAWLWLTTRDLDPIFYVTHYEDLRILNSERALRQHYARHGRSEGRLPSKTALNAQLDGHNDRRPSSGHRRLRSNIIVAQLLAWSGDRLSRIPTNRREAIRLLMSRGVDEQWPIRFDFLFDWQFYVQTYRMPAKSRKSPASAYRHFLTRGIKKGYAPNETAYLFPYLGGMPYPEQFDWGAYSRSETLAPAGRVGALKHLFKPGKRDYSRYITYLGRDAPRLLTSIGRHALVRGRAETAVAAFEAATTLTNAGTVTCLLGDSYLKLGRVDEALEAYQRSIESGSGPIWAYFHCVDIFCKRRDYDAAFDVLRQAFRPWRHKAEFGHKLDRCVDLYFQHQSSRAHELYRTDLIDPSSPSSRESADRLLTSTLDRIKALYCELDDLPAPTGGQADGHVVILANDSLRQCTHYRVEQKIEQLEAAGIPVQVFSHEDVAAFMGSLVGARAAIFYRVAALPNILRAILHANAMGLTTYYEIDDLIFDSACYPDPFDSFEGQISVDEYAGLRYGVPLFRYAMSMCQGSIASTSALSAAMQRVTQTPLNVVLPNGLDSRNETWSRFGERSRASSNDRIRIFYGSGTKAHNADFNDLVGPALIELMQRFPEVELVIVGHLKLRADLAAFGDRIHVFPFTPNLDVYWSLLASCDINVAVLHPGDVADCKSEIKWLEAAILRIPSVVSETATYREVIADGVDGYIATNTEDWTQYLHDLVVDEAVRRRIGANARKKALKGYDLEAGAGVLNKVFEKSARSDPHLPAQRRLRVLICNVFFHPQSHGGATRVVEDNIRSLSRRYKDLDIGVFCSDEGAGPAGKLRMGNFGPIPVYRLATPVEPRMDWRPFNRENASSFARVLDDFQPDIIHFHCIQRLTASIVEEALSRNIPYIVTLHDGWWISDFQFLVDDDGFLRLPTADIIDDCANRPSPAVSIERRQRLRALLHDASAVLSVSEAFRQIYDNAGVEGVRVVENGLPELHSAERKPRTDGRLALGHIGGRSAHKGAYLIEAALRQENYSNLHLTMVDGSLAPGETVETTWGTTPVTLTGPYPQSEVGELYGQLNVLLAPSTWPESYGLVTREALSCGLWVVASDLGAIGEGVVDGRNGYTIDTRTTAELKRILHHLNEHHDRYFHAAEKCGPALRQADEQAQELHSIYWGVADAVSCQMDGEQPKALSAASN